MKIRTNSAGVTFKPIPMKCEAHKGLDSGD
ncbi:hypothetical protein S2091_0328 [Solimicrobium silvestre]|uniref:Uncharacterized protein n=1 Tax=Solimicrobium silvestre TaxID=2099400 RepID=A0A2S9H5C3_9BURK|nr:hypothetical protein S2091_0328 [Solimicrobium silvestre]